MTAKFYKLMKNGTVKIKEILFCLFVNNRFFGRGGAIDQGRHSKKTTIGVFTNDHTYDPTQ